MQPNVHTPERLDGESMTAYRARQAESRRQGRLVRYVRSAGSNPYARSERAIKRDIGARQYRIERKAYARNARAA